MRPIKFLATFFTTLFIIACGGGSSNKNINDVPISKTYGIFRNLKNKVAPIYQGATSTNTSITMYPRAYHRAIQMLNGKVLLCGGDVDITQPPTMDIFDPETETFTHSNAHPNVYRRYQLGFGTGYQSFAMVNLPDGKVAIIGAQDDSQSAYSGRDIYEIYDPVNDTLTDITYVGQYLDNGTIDYGLGIIDAVDAAYYIGNDRIMIFLTSTRQVILDLKTNVLTPLINNSLENIGSVAGASTIQDVNGDIYFIGGYLINANSTSPAGTTIANISKYQASTGTWIKCSSMKFSRAYASLVLLANNRIGIYGGQTSISGTGDNTPIKSVEVYNIAYDAVSQSLDLVGSRTKAAACYLQTGYTLVSGGMDDTLQPQKSQLSHNVSQLYSGSTGDMTTSRIGLTTTPLPNGLVLIAGGDGSSTSINTGEIFDPQSAIYINYKSEQMALGYNMQFTAKDASGANISPTWSIDDTSVATIDSNGLLTPIKNGVVTITANFNGNSAVARVRILPT